MERVLGAVERLHLAEAQLKDQELRLEDQKEQQAKTESRLETLERGYRRRFDRQELGMKAMQTELRKERKARERLEELIQRQLLQSPGRIGGAYVPRSNTTTAAFVPQLRTGGSSATKELREIVNGVENGTAHPEEQDEEPGIPTEAPNGTAKEDEEEDLWGLSSMTDEELDKLEWAVLMVQCHWRGCRCRRGIKGAMLKHAGSAILDLHRDSALKLAEDNQKVERERVLGEDKGSSSTRAPNIGGVGRNMEKSWRRMRTMKTGRLSGRRAEGTDCPTM